MDDPLAFSHFAPIGLTILLLAIGSVLPRRPRILRRVFIGVAPLALCLTLFDRGDGAGFRWSMHFLIAPGAVLVAGQMIWRGRWSQGRRSFTFRAMLGISAAYLILIPPIFFEMPETAGPGTRWIVWLFAWIVMAISALIHLMLRRGAPGRARDTG